jgi:hypothetical protein
LGAALFAIDFAFTSYLAYLESESEM